MARPLRLQFEGAVYHVMSRGHERGRIFVDDDDRLALLDEIKRVVEEKGWIVHGYCLMTNHIHLLVETPQPNLSAGMQMVSSRYSQAFNRRHGRAGHLLEGRYKAILVEKDAYLLELSRYIVLNPVKAKAAARPEQWKWSNYRATAGLVEKPSWLEVDWTLEQFGTSRAGARDRYRKFVSEGKGAPSPLLEVKGQVFLGGEAFLHEMQKKLAKTKPDRAIPRAQRELVFVPIAKIRTAVAEEFGIDEKRLDRMRGGADKVAALYLARRLSGLSGREIGEAFGVTATRVSNVARDVEKGAWRKLQSVVARLERSLRKESDLPASR